MRKACEQTVDKLGINLWATAGLCPESTASPKYLTSQVFFIRGLCTKIEQLMSAYKQLRSSIFNLLALKLYPLSTAPINNTNLN